MPKMPREPEAFAEQVAAMLRRLHPDHEVDLVGPREMVVNGRRLDLENLYANVQNHGGDAVEFLDRVPLPRVAYVHVARGAVTVNGERLGPGDALKLGDVPQIELKDGENAEVLLFDLK